jgi:peptide deformylase
LKKFRELGTPTIVDIGLWALYFSRPNAAVTGVPVEFKPVPLLEILHYPDPRLRNKARAVTRFDAALKQLVEDMFETMYTARGIGLAATQVNVHERLLILDVSEDKTEPLCLINPLILWREGKAQREEGCLSLPGVYETVERSEKIRVRAQDRDGRDFEMEAEGLLGVCIQHEMDHLDGKLFIDHLSSIKRQRVRKKIEQQREPS